MVRAFIRGHDSGIFAPLVVNVPSLRMRQRCRSDAGRNGGKSADCPEDEVLQALAAGIGPPGLMELHGSHIVDCERCALLLKTYVSDFTDELTAEEEAVLSELETSKPEWQRKLVQEILRRMPSSRTPK